MSAGFQSELRKEQGITNIWFSLCKKQALRIGVCRRMLGMSNTYWWWLNLISLYLYLILVQNLQYVHKIGSAEFAIVRHIFHIEHNKVLEWTAHIHDSANNFQNLYGWDAMGYNACQRLCLCIGTPVNFALVTYFCCRLAEDVVFMYGSGLWPWTSPAFIH